MTDQVAQVGTELKIDLTGTDPDGDQLTYGYKSADELKDLGARANITVSPSGSGVFRWTPNASDVGEHSFDFSVSDGANQAIVTITIDVRSAIGGATSPIFRQPLGSGTTIDMLKKKCVDLNIVVEDQNSAQVELTMMEPVIPGATLTQRDGLTASFSWCPTKAQEAEQRYTLAIAADDGENPKTIKNYLVVLRSGTGAGCPGTAPTITHTPENPATIVNLTVDAQFTDDKGLKVAPLFYYSETPPANPPVLSSMTQLNTLLLTGTNKNGTYAADVPNPVAGMPAGAQKTLYYLFVADDDDDATGGCDHSTASQVYQTTVTSTGSANQPICATCTADSQCGTGDLCVRMGNMGASYCLQACAGGCPTGYACSATDLYSVNGASARQCVPSNGSCEAPTAACMDDTSEDNDTRAEAEANATARGPLVADEFYNFISCPKVNPPAYGEKADQDWFELRTTGDTKLDLFMVGDDATDLDLNLYKNDGTLVSKSTSFESDENIIKCVPAGTYYVMVNGYQAIRNEYLFQYTAVAESCNTTCVDDTYDTGRDDDTYSQARTTFPPVHTSTGNVICPNDDDYYKVRLTTGQRLTLDMTMPEAGSTKDLDFHLYRGFTDLWPCSYDDWQSCDPEHGQSGSPTEHAEYVVPAGCSAGCDYFVVVRGYNGSSSPYSATIRVE